MSDLDLDDLRAELEDFAQPEKKGGRSAREERIIAGFEEIQRFVDQHGRPPQHGEGRRRRASLPHRLVATTMTEDEMTVEIGNLAGLDLFALRERWRTLYGSEPPLRMSRELMMRAIAYRMQENAFGGLSRSANARLMAAAEEGERSGGKVSRVRTDRTIKPGTKFLREWNGRTHEVMALADGGFAYRGTVYRSLSAIAREITGTRWSGPVFFGLEAGKGSSGRSKRATRDGEPGPGGRRPRRREGVDVPA